MGGIIVAIPLQSLDTLLKPTVLLTRPREDAEKLAQRLSSQLLVAQCIIAPVMTIVGLAPQFDGSTYKGVILTSRHAVSCATQFFPTLTAYCVGDATKLAAQAAGLNAVSAHGASDDLIEVIKRENISPLVHLHGAHTAGDVAIRLNDAGIQVRSFAVYDQEEVNWSQGTHAHILAARHLIVPLYSPRSAALVGARLAKSNANITIIAISGATAHAWTGPKPALTILAEHPNGESMQKAIASQLA